MERLASSIGYAAGDRFNGARRFQSRELRQQWRQVQLLSQRIEVHGPYRRPRRRASRLRNGFTFGVYPLQQYLIAMPGGRLQALGIAWDSRSRDQGGQRWFFLYPGQRVTNRDPLHWTALDQTWNYMCADCHSTNLRKNYSLQTRGYA